MPVIIRTDEGAPHRTPNTDRTMATRSRIGIVLPGGRIRSVYSHWDGYPEHNGRILRDRFNTTEKVEALIAGGDISCLWCDETWDRTHREPQPLYYSERGDEVSAPIEHADLKAYLYEGEEYHYVWYPKPQRWVCYSLKGPIPEGVEIPEGSAG